MSFLVSPSRRRSSGAGSRSRRGRPRRRRLRPPGGGRRSSLGRAAQSCHAIRGTSASGDVGPDLTHLASRADARRAHDPEHAVQYLAQLDRRLAAGQAGEPDARPRPDPRTSLDDLDRLPRGAGLVAVVAPPTPHARRADRPARARVAEPPRRARVADDHRPQADRPPLLLDDARLLRGRRGGGADHAHPARARRTSDVVSPSTYDQLFSMHGITMIFFFIIPMTTGAFGNYLLPLMIGARDMAFPRMNALSYWIFLASGIFVYTSLVHGHRRPNAGWFDYVPLANRDLRPRPRDRLLLPGDHLQRHRLDADRGAVHRHDPQVAARRGCR